MPLVEVQEHIAAPLDDVWGWINDIERHPSLMEPVISVEVLERSADHRIAAWEVELKGCVMRWVEREDLHPDRHRIDYHQIDGDLQTFAGFWQLAPANPSATTATLSVEFEIGTPMLSEMLNPVAERAIRENSRSMLRALAAHAVAGVR